MNAIALSFIKARESFRPVAYRKGDGVWTVGYGATGAGIAEGTVWTPQEAEQDLAARTTAAEATVRKLAAGVALKAEQEAALISFEYNCGGGALAGSHLLAFVKARNWLAAAKAFLTWDHVDGVELPGLLKRRMEEAALFLDAS